MLTPSSLPAPCSGFVFASPKGMFFVDYTMRRTAYTLASHGALALAYAVYVLANEYAWLAQVSYRMWLPRRVLSGGNGMAIACTMSFGKHWQRDDPVRRKNKKDKTTQHARPPLGDRSHLLFCIVSDTPWVLPAAMDRGCDYGHTTCGSAGLLMVSLGMYSSMLLISLTRHHSQTAFMNHISLTPIKLTEQRSP